MNSNLSINQLLKVFGRFLRAPTLRQKLTITLLLLYWPAIFIATHIPKVPSWVIRTHLSDKILHGLGYLVLICLLWAAIKPFEKVNWRKATVWWILFVVVWYGVLDEWLQGYVGRNSSAMDFFADLAGAIGGLILLSIFSFWSMSLLVTGAAIFILTSLIQANLAELLPVVNVAFHLFAYGLFSLLWIRCMYNLLPVEPPQSRWLIGALALPTGFLLSIELFSVVAGNTVSPLCVIISIAVIVGVVGIHYITAFFRKNRDSY